MQDIIHSLAAGDITLLNSIIWLLIALIAALAGGAVGGILVGGKHMGNELAAMMGAFFGPIAAIPGIVLGLVILVFMSSVYPGGN